MKEKNILHEITFKIIFLIMIPSSLGLFASRWFVIKTQVKKWLLSLDSNQEPSD